MILPVQPDMTDAIQAALDHQEQVSLGPGLFGTSRPIYLRRGSTLSGQRATIIRPLVPNIEACVIGKAVESARVEQITFDMRQTEGNAIALYPDEKDKRCARCAVCSNTFLHVNRHDYLVWNLCCVENVIRDNLLISDFASGEFIGHEGIEVMGGSATITGNVVVGLLGHGINIISNRPNKDPRFPMTKNAEVTNVIVEDNHVYNCLDGIYCGVNNEDCDTISNVNMIGNTIRRSIEQDIRVTAFKGKRLANIVAVNNHLDKEPKLFVQEGVIAEGIVLKPNFL